MAKKFITKYDVPVGIFNIGRFLPPSVIPFQRGTVVDTSPLNLIQAVAGELNFTIGGKVYTATLRTDPIKRVVKFAWEKEE